MKIIGLFSVVRGYNIPIVVVAQYLAAIFVFTHTKKPLDVFLDLHFFIIVLCSTLAIASGYIINSFYDSKKDLINRPNKTKLDVLVRQSTKLKLYFFLNFGTTILAFFVSWRASFFFSAYIFLIWIYSHKIKKKPIIGNLASAFLAIFPFFGTLLYYKYIDEVIFFHAFFLFCLLLIKDLIKDLINIAGDFSNNYKTLPVLYGETTTKRIITILYCLTVVPVYFLIELFDVGYMDIYFYIYMIISIFIIKQLWKSQKKLQYRQLHTLLKIIIVAGVLSIALINPSILEN